jgi:hypothetical protein
VVRASDRLPGTGWQLAFSAPRTWSMHAVAVAGSKLPVAPGPLMRAVIAASHPLVHAA